MRLVYRDRDTMTSAFRIALRTMPGAMLCGAAGAFAVIAALTFGIWIVEGRNTNPESHAMGVGALATLSLAFFTTLVLWFWGRRLRRVLATGDRFAGEVSDVIRGRETRVVVRIGDASERRITVIGPVALRQGDVVTLRKPSGREWPLLIETVFEIDE